MITSCAPTPFMRSNMPSAWRSRLPSIISAGNLLGTTRTRHPGESFGAAGPPAAEGRYPRISGGVFDSLPGQNGQNPPLILNDSREKSEGRRERSVEMMTQPPAIGSLRRSGTDDYFTRKNDSAQGHHLSEVLLRHRERVPEQSDLRLRMFEIDGDNIETRRRLGRHLAQIFACNLA